MLRVFVGLLGGMFFVFFSHSVRFCEFISNTGVSMNYEIMHMSIFTINLNRI